MSLDPRDGECLRRSPLFAQLDDEAFERLARFASRVHHEAEQILFEDGDESDRFYVVLAGRCEVVNYDASTDQVDVIATIGPGLCVGELPLLRPGPRSATVRVSPDTTLAAFPIEAFRRELHGSLPDGYRPLILQLEAHVVEIVTSTTARTIELLAHRQRVSVFIIYLISLLCAFMFVTQWLGSMTAEATGTTIITLPIIIVIMLVLIRPIRALGLPWAAYGITRLRSRESLRDGLLLAIPIVLGATAVKLAIVSFSPAHADVPVFDCIESLTSELGSSAAAVRHFVLFNLVYVVVVVPLQELIARGLLQGLMERFIVSEHRTVLAILISNLIFGAFHLYLSLAAALATVVLGVYFGWIYVRTRNLLGACVAHAIIGTWMLTVVRLQAIVT